MLRYFLVRLADLLPKLAIISVVIFIAMQFIPGDPVMRSMPIEQYQRLSPEQIARITEDLGLNDSKVEQYFRWLGNILKGDLGYSMNTRSSIKDAIAQRMPATLQLAALGLCIATVFGLLFGYIAALKKNSPLDYTLTTVGMIGLSMPEFFLGLCMIVIFAIHLNWFPTGGWLAYGQETVWDKLRYLFLPAVSLGITYIATLMRYTRASMLDVLNKDYIRTARSKGISETEVNVKHGFRNAMIPVITIIIFRLPMLVSGTVVIEVAFNYPGMGTLMLGAIKSLDQPVVMASALIIATGILMCSFLLDIVIALLDPRVSFAGRGGE